MRGLAFVLALSALPVAARAPYGPVENMRERFFTDKTEYAYGEPITVYVQRYNAGDEPIGYGTTPCTDIVRLDGYDVDYVCTQLERLFEYAPGRGVEIAYTLYPDTLGFPTASGTDHTIEMRGDFERATLSITAPQYLGGQISVGVADGADPDEVATVREALNVVEVENLFGTVWQISGLTPEQAADEYGSSPLFDDVEPVRLHPEGEARTLREVEPDVLLSVGTDQPTYFPSDTIRVSVALTNLTGSRLDLRFNEGFQAGYDLGEVVGSCTCVWTTKPTSVIVAPGQYFSWSDQGQTDDGLGCFDYVPVPGFCEALEPGDYTVSGYVVGYYGPIDVPITVLPPVASEPEAPPTSASLTAAPNPFAERTTLSLTLPAPRRVEAVAYDVLGRRVAVLHEGPLPAGTHTLAFEAARLPAGLYVVRVQASGGGPLSLTRRVTLAR